MPSPWPDQILVPKSICFLALSICFFEPETSTFGSDRYWSKVLNIRSIKREIRRLNKRQGQINNKLIHQKSNMKMTSFSCSIFGIWSAKFRGWERKPTGSLSNIEAEIDQRKVKKLLWCRNIFSRSHHKDIPGLIPRTIYNHYKLFKKNNLKKISGRKFIVTKNIGLKFENLIKVNDLLNWKDINKSTWKE